MVKKLLLLLTMISAASLNANDTGKSEPFKYSDYNFSSNTPLRKQCSRPSMLEPLLYSVRIES